MSDVVELLKLAGYSDKAIELFMKKVNVGEISNPDVSTTYTGICGDTMKIFLKIENGKIKDAKFQAIGCAGSFAAGSALTEMIKNKSLEEAEKITEKDIIGFLGKIPEQKLHCANLAKKTLEKAINDYRGKAKIKHS
ncbi:iron-sulfur cluster assembly scaffold protein [Candidatus Bathyarchaeota archaeon]|nr:MAG: iron-sulfur cluster assembly scaffold protein [Candidatus Bathyarchaeota archaeon]